jgi:hypothetical protein
MVATKKIVKLWTSVLYLGPFTTSLQISYFCLIFQTLDLMAFVVRNSKTVSCLHPSGLYK